MYSKPNDGGSGFEINITNDLHLDMLHVIAENIEKLTQAINDLSLNMTAMHQEGF